MQQNTKISGSICLSDIPKEAITTAKNGKKYLNLDLMPKKETDKFGNDVTIAIGKTKEQRESKAETIYIGNGKTFDFSNNQTQNQPPIAVQADLNADDTDLPF